MFEQVEPKEEIPDVEDEVKSEITVDDEAMVHQNVHVPR
jgi:hypothetical protein